MEATGSQTYSCTTSSPAALPVLATVSRISTTPPGADCSGVMEKSVYPKGYSSSRARTDTTVRPAIPDNRRTNWSGRPMGLWLYWIGTWPTERGTEIGSLPPGLMSPNNAPATAAPPSSPGSHASRIAGAFSRQPGIESGRPLISTATVGLPAPTTASASSCCTPGRPSSARSRVSPEVQSRVNPDLSPRTRMTASACAAAAAASAIPERSEPATVQPAACNIRAFRPARARMRFQDRWDFDRLLADVIPIQIRPGSEFPVRARADARPAPHPPDRNSPRSCCGSASAFGPMTAIVPGGRSGSMPSFFRRIRLCPAASRASARWAGVSKLAAAVCSSAYGVLEQPEFEFGFQDRAAPRRRSPRW